MSNNVRKSSQISQRRRLANYWMLEIVINASLRKKWRSRRRGFMLSTLRVPRTLPLLIFRSKRENATRWTSSRWIKRREKRSFSASSIISTEEHRKSISISTSRGTGQFRSNSISVSSSNTKLSPRPRWGRMYLSSMPRRKLQDKHPSIKFRIRWISWKVWSSTLSNSWVRLKTPSRRPLKIFTASSSFVTRGLSRRRYPQQTGTSPWLT